jgi:hypothetical protein
MIRHRIAITTNTPRLGLHQLAVDGHDISHGVSTLTMRLESGSLPVVELELGIVEIERVEAEEAELYIPDATRDALITLGWTPPGAGPPPTAP